MRVGQTGEKTGETNIIDETDITFYLVPKGDEGELHPDPDPEEKESFFEYTYFPDKPVPAIGGNGIGIPSSGQRVQTSIEEREDVCVYVSEVLAEDVLVVGVVKVEVVLQCFSYREGVSAKREITLIARGMKLTRLCSHAPVSALLPARFGQTGLGKYQFSPTSRGCERLGGYSRCVVVLTLPTPQS